MNKQIDEIEKAYGACHKCYGKGYATVSGRWQGLDTDQDIGSPGGVVKGGKDFVMKFCTCERGTQLEALLNNLIVRERLDEWDYIETIREASDIAILRASEDRIKALKQKLKEE